MRLLYLHNTSLDSEKANLIQVIHMCNAFSESDVQVILALPESKMKINNINNFFADRFGEPNDFEIIFYPKITIRGRFNTIGGYWGAKEVLKRISPCKCYVRNPLFLNLAINYGFTAIFESHNSLLHNRSLILDWFWKKNILRTARKDELLRFITISSALADIWKKRGVPEKKILVLHDGFNKKYFENQKTRAEARSNLGLPIEQKIVVYTGSLYPNREIENILILAHRFPEILFLIIGGPEKYVKHYKDTAQNQHIENVTFKGRVPPQSVPEYLFSADVLLMIWSRKVPTIHYCSPLKMFEYMASGRIIVGHGFPPIKEVLTDRYTAYLADPDSFQELCEKLNQALNKVNTSEMANRARKLVFDNYSWKKRAQTILHSIDMYC